MKNAVSEVQNSFGVLTSRRETTEERMNELEDR
jgi:hypothetical protein